MNKLILQIGERVEVKAGTPLYYHPDQPLFYAATAKVADVDPTPFDYDIVRIEIEGLPYIPPPDALDWHLWVSEKYLNRI
jgi:hypothetical protein